MEELLNRMKSKHGLSEEESLQVLNTIKDYIIEKFPMVGGALDSFFPSSGAKDQGNEGGNADHKSSSKSNDPLDY